MGNNHEGCIRGFYNSSEAWYSKMVGSPFKDEDKEVVFGWYVPNEGTTGEMGMHWHELGNESVPRLEVFSDSWHALFTFADVLESLADRDGENITPKAFCDLLVSLGFTDLTKYERPQHDG